jgi:hypothetical protein
METYLPASVKVLETDFAKGSCNYNICIYTGAGTCSISAGVSKTILMYLGIEKTN